MKNFIPLLICLLSLFVVSVRDNTFNILPPTSWYDVIGCLIVIGTVASFIWGVVQQTEDNELRRSNNRKDSQRRVLLGHSPVRKTTAPLAPPKSPSED